MEQINKEQLLQTEMHEYFNQTFNDLLLKEQGCKDAADPQNMQSVSQYTFTRVRLRSC
jgi:hypothetical protein